MEAGKCEGFSNVVILGAGAIGSYYGALLSRKNDVLLIGKKDHVDEINDEGLKVSGSLNEKFRIRASVSLENIPKYSLILLTTKAQDSARTIKGVRRLLSPESKILVLQNGLRNEELVESLISPNIEVIRGLTSSGVEFFSPGEIRVKQVGETVLPSSESGRRVKRLFDSCGLETRVSDNMSVEVWRKLTMNCVINPLSAIFRVANREIAAESLLEVRSRIVDECIKVANEEGVALDSSICDDITRAAGQYSNFSSMCQDVMKGNRTEIDFLNGRITELGRKHRIETPINNMLFKLIKFMEGTRWT